MKDEEQFDCKEKYEEKQGDNRSSVVYISMLCATAIALVCEVINLVEVIVNRKVSFPMFALSFLIVGIFPIVFNFTKISTNKKLFIMGIICLVISLAFVILWVLTLCKVIK